MTASASSSSSQFAPLSTADIRERYLRFFESKGHLRLASYSTVAPDPTTLFTVAGMQPFKEQFMGAPAVFGGVASKRVTTAQKCLRIGDIENVGRTLRHCSLLEMLGNFSFGDYFKRESLTWAWEFLTSPEWLGLDKSRLYATIYQDDEEAFTIWTEENGLPADHILRFGADENFWPADAPKEGPNGPCGPCSEIFYDRGPKYGDDTWAEYAETRESARFLEIWNNVFPQFDRQEPLADGTPVLKDLPFKNIDTGMGLERIATVVQDVYDFYSNDVFAPIVAKVAEMSGQAYEGPQSVSHRVVAEHIRSVSMVIADGSQPSNTGRGYVVRKILRRACRHAYLLGLREPSLFRLVPIVVERMGGAYPELRENEAKIAATVRAEEESFLRTLEGGIQRLGKLLSGMEKGATLSGSDAFVLYDTYGFPVDLTKEIAEEYGVSVDEAGYAESLENAQNLARAGSKYGKSELFGGNQEALDGLSPTVFVGYDDLQADGEVVALVGAGERLKHLPAGSEATVVLSRTPFYAEGGGEVGDTGRIEWDGGAGVVRDTRKTPQGVFLHDVLVESGELKEGVSVRAAVSGERQAIQRHHTATHLLQSALRAVLGGGVQQKGSLVAADRLRFDFSHGAPLSAEEIAAVEALVGRWVSANFPVTWQEMPIADAKAAGATALFGEKYGETVRVVRVGGSVEYAGQTVSSMELCGGAHVTRTGDIGAFVILSDENVAAGVRRVEALAGEQATAWVRERLNATAKTAALLNTSPDNLEGRVTGLQAQLKAAEKDLSGLRRQVTQLQMGAGGGGSAGAPLREIGGYRVAAVQLSGVESGELRGAADTLLESSGADLVVIATDKGLVVKATKDAVARGAHAGQLIGRLAAAGGGKGGGRPDMAQAGITDPAAALAALDSSLS
ncbi:alanine--tRNA ligase [Deinococcus aquiradiocola]|uniref:Alanine--tRNA ligase n=1 Tax=Deinococcus aquiradiocola TaxID=393059 RepID=A0A917PEF3_9DEIO|nr:alanine--tRNA ligase [Deinococcus aquiradiocola]GGJ73200.1 alanine--tRNA ligase [Deinococcus aquiradiocola]